MAPTYCIVKLFQRATYERLKRTLDGYGDSSDDNSINDLPMNTNRSECRICLKEGGIPIFNADGALDIANAIQVFADIPIAKNDGHSEYICDACLRLLQGAIYLRKTAKKSNEIIKRRTTTDSCCQNYNDHPQNANVNGDKARRMSIMNKYFLPVDSNDGTSKARKMISKVQCQICYKVITKSYYKEHFSLHELAPIKHVCDVCGKGFRLKSAYRAHLFTHSTDFPYKCQLCPYRGRYAGLLNTHMRTHKGDYKYKCMECPAKFIYKCNLNKHALRHKEPMLQCSDCKRAFHSQLLADRHYEVEHLGVKNHVCPLCGKAFGYRKAMMRHQLDVHKRKKKLNGRTPSYLEFGS